MGTGGLAGTSHAMTSRIRTQGCAATVLLALTAGGCGFLGEPERDRPKRLSEAQTPVTDRRIQVLQRNDPRRTVLEFVQALQYRDWRLAYGRLISRRLRAQFSFKRFVLLSSAQRGRLLLPFRIVGRTRRGGGVASVRTRISNPVDATVEHDSYELVRAGPRWLVAFASGIADQDVIDTETKKREARLRPRPR